VVPLVTPTERDGGASATTRLATWLLESADARPRLDADLGLSPWAAPRYGLTLDRLTELPPLAGTVDVLLADPREPRDAVIMELRRLRLPPLSRTTTLRLPVAELAMTVRHVNRLAEIGFGRIWLLLCLAADDLTPTDPAAVLKQVDEGPVSKLLHLSVGLAFAVVPLVPGAAPFGPLKLLVRRPAVSVHQSARVTTMVARLYQPRPG